ncbi:uncharacterized protein LOC109857355 [Pseudomyrmex gracilis]|uniref:uncharacterized protein LOC109857355 n=1 Tax=Pseudomyrmex gracilis TaxID=219809 RepID=UPI000994E02F|nr:uncharacterized protein LOC109857355 [Pseudomyrmex gracilis]XP_020289151.1 uncharacterized protein LOC109857355 [Pseudomyrmex gracilis]
MRPLLEMLLVVVALATRTRGLPYGEAPPQLSAEDQLVYGNYPRASQAQDNVFPNYKENIVPQQIGQFDYQQSQQNTFEGYETQGQSLQQEQQNPDYAYQSHDQTLQTSYPSAADDFTISCTGENKVCVARSLCNDGYVHPLKQGFVRSGQVQECRLSHEVCCTVRYDNSPYDNNDQINSVLGPKYPEPTLENDERYVPYGENNQEDVTSLNPPLKTDGESQSASNGKYAIKSPNQSAEEAPVDYNHIPADTNQQTQYQSGDFSASEPVLPIKSAPTNSNPASVFQFSIPSGCAAALLCVEEQYCTLEGVISKEPVALTSSQLLRRVPLSSCKNPETGVIGKCCRDPDYVDPWPTGNLPANYSGGFDEQGFPTFLNIAKVRPPTRKPPTKTILRPPVTQPPLIHEQPTNVVQTLVIDNTDVTPQRVIPISTQIPITSPSTPAPFTKPPYESGSSIQPEAIVPDVPPLSQLPELPPLSRVPELPPLSRVPELPPLSRVPELPPLSQIPELPPNNPCGVRNYEQRPHGFRDSDAAFAEIPWQAMVLWSEERKILCSGALVAVDVVLTSAGCVNKFEPKDISVKLGEWKLGYELKHEEPLPFEIINVRTIKYHPGYVQGLSSNDTAMLILEHPASFNLHINTLCLPDNYQVQETSQCIVTGWGKSILQAHYAGAIMHMVDVDLLSHDVCQNRLLGAESQLNIAHNIICGKAHDENNMCQADIGAPLACYDGKGAYHIAGIYSQDTGCLPTNQVATFAPIDMTWVKQTMHSHIDTPQIVPDDGYDYRKSTLPAGSNQYLPPV